MSREIELLTEIRDLLLVMAEPSLEKRDWKQRSSLRSVVGSGQKKAKATLLMDGSHSRPAIVKESGIDQGDLSRLVKALAAAQLISAGDQNLKLLVKIPPTFFDGEAADE